MGKQIRFDNEARESLRRGVEQLAAAVRVTLGPRGRNVVIDRGDGAPTITNDGLAIAREIQLANPFENLGVQLLREVAVRTGEAAGDGTTTATVLASSLVEHGLGAVAAGHNPAAVRRGIERAIGTVVEELKRQSRSVRDRDEIARLAAVTAQDDAAVGRLVADAMERVGRQGVITVGEGQGLETTLEVVEGMRLEAGYLSPYFVTDADSMEACLEDAFVLVADLRVSAAGELLPALELAARAGRPLLVVAEDVEGEALATLVVNRLRGTLPSAAVRVQFAGERRRELLEDLAIFTGARLYAPERGTRLEEFVVGDFGRVRRVIVDSGATTLTEGGGQAPAIRERAAELRRAARACEWSPERDWLEQRLGRLSGGVAVVRVGAATNPQRLERRSRVENALAATRSAVEEGVVPGGGVALLRAQPALDSLATTGDEGVGVAIVHRAIEQPALQIAENAGENGAAVVEAIRARRGAVGFDAITGSLRDLARRGILDPTRVTRCALQNAASIGALLLTADVIVVDSPDADEEEQQPPAA